MLNICMWVDHSGRHVIPSQMKDFFKNLCKLLVSLCKLFWGKSNKPACGCELPALKKPDPFLYSQNYLISLGLPVTWDNPDISIYQGGVLVDPHDLQPATAYEVVARIWNNSTDTPVVNMPVNFSYLSFGMGTQSHPIGQTAVDLNAKGLPGCPAFAQMVWVTPTVPGHYCIQVLLEPLADLNWVNNLGQRNTDVAQANSPAVFKFRVGNHDSPRPRTVKFTADAYAIPPLPPCSEQKSAGSANPALVPVPVPAGWIVDIAPVSLLIPPGDEQDVQVSITPAAMFKGIAPVNITAWDNGRPIGGVTLNVEVL